MDFKRNSNSHDAFEKVISTEAIFGNICSYLSKKDLLNLSIVNKQCRLLSSKSLWTSAPIKLNSDDVNGFLEFLEENPDLKNWSLKFYVQVYVTSLGFVGTSLLADVQKVSNLMSIFGLTSVVSLRIKGEWTDDEGKEWDFVNQNEALFSEFCSGMLNITCNVEYLDMDIYVLRNVYRYLRFQNHEGEVSWPTWASPVFGPNPILKSAILSMPHLNILYLDEIYAETINYLATNCPQLVHLHIGICKKASCEALKKARFPKLRTLILLIAFKRDPYSADIVPLFVRLLETFLPHVFPGLKSLELVFMFRNYDWVLRFPSFVSLRHIGVYYQDPEMDDPPGGHFVVENLRKLSEVRFPNLTKISLDLVTFYNTVPRARLSPTGPLKVWLTPPSFSSINPNHKVTKLSITTGYTAGYRTLVPEDYQEILERNLRTLSTTFPSISELRILDVCEDKKCSMLKYMTFLLTHLQDLFRELEVLEVENYVDDWLTTLCRYSEPVQKNLRTVKTLKFPKPDPCILSDFGAYRFFLDVKVLSSHLVNLTRIDINPDYKLSTSHIRTRDEDLARLEDTCPNIEINPYY